MPWLTVVLRTAALAAVVLAVVDPGCARPARPRLGLTFAGAWPDGLRMSTLRQLQASTPWADVVVSDRETRVDAFLVAGDAAPVLAHLREHAADMALRMEGPPLEVTAVDLPTGVTVGSRVALAVHVRANGAALPSARLTVADAVTGVTEATVDHHGSGGVVLVPWLAGREGPRRLKVRAEPLEAPAGRPSPWVDVEVHVGPARFRTHLLEARPTWAGRFTRLALAASGNTGLSLDVRAAPGVTVRRADAGAQTAEAGADVVVASGLESLTGGDVLRLERLVRDGGRVLVLLLDEPPAPGPWRRLWASDLGRVESAGAPRAVDVAGVRWRTREWLAGVSSTGAVALAYVDSGAPAVLARAVGEGRVVLVTALDAWRWRAEPDVDWAGGWQALIGRLAADVPPPVAVTAWVSGSGNDRVVQVDVRVRRDVAAREMPSLEARLADDAGVRRLTLAAVQRRRWRGAARVDRDGTHRVDVAMPTTSAVEARGTAVVHVGRVIAPADWHEVRRHQEARGALAADLAAPASPLATLQTRLASDDGPRWFASRTWWFAALVLAGLGSEWVIRRVRRLG